MASKYQAARTVAVAPIELKQFDVLNNRKCFIDENTSRHFYNLINIGLTFDSHCQFFDICTHGQPFNDMASEQKFVDYILDQTDTGGQVTYKKMFGEYGLYFGDKLFALVCDNKLFIKPTLSGRQFIDNVVEASPYPGAKPSFLISEKLDDRDWLKKLVAITVKELPEPKPKQKKQKKK
jgi:TfoX/Sxy family transcriptional regulator of competence genes